MGFPKGFLDYKSGVESALEEMPKVLMKQSAILVKVKTLMESNAAKNSHYRKKQALEPPRHLENDTADPNTDAGVGFDSRSTECLAF